MRVLWVHNFDPNIVASGVFMHRLYEEMRSQGVDITLHYSGNLRGVFRILCAARQVRAISREYDLVHAQFGSACGLIVSFAHARRLVTFRGTDLLGETTGNLFDRSHGLASRLFSRITLRRLRNVVTVSHRMRREIQRIARGAMVDVVPSGINLQEFQPMDRSEARGLLGEGHNTAPWILFSSIANAHQRPGKRFWLAAAAFESLRARYPTAELKVMTGVAPDRVPLWVNASNVLLLTSLREGWPNIVKEALACNIPFVSTDVSDLATIASVEPNCFVADATPEAIAESLLSALKYPEPRNLRRHVEPIEVGAIARQLNDIYRRIGAQSQTQEIGCQEYDDISCGHGGHSIG